jgi:hypothetical protein
MNMGAAPEFPLYEHDLSYVPGRLGARSIGESANMLTQRVLADDRYPSTFALDGHPIKEASDQYLLCFRRMDEEGMKSALEKVTNYTLGQARRRFSEQEHFALDAMVEMVYDGFTSSKKRSGDEGPLMMAMQGHQLIAHTVHTAYLLNHILPSHATLGMNLTAWGHDFVEDVNYGKSKKDGIQEAKLRLNNYLEEIKRAHLDPRLLNSVRISLISMDRLQIREGYAYTRGIERTHGDLHIPGFTNAELEQSKQDALMVKLCDKTSAVDTISPFRPEKRIRILGKTWWVINETRKYIANYREERGERLSSKERERLDDMRLLSTQAARTMYRSVRTMLDTLERDFHKLYPSARPEIVQGRINNNYELLRGYVRTGGLRRIERWDEEVTKRHENFSRTIYAAIVLGLNLKGENPDIPESLRRSEESYKDALARIGQEQKEFREELPDENIEALVGQLTKQLQPGARRMVGLNDEAREKYLRLHRRLILLATISAKYVLEEEFAIGGV